MKKTRKGLIRDLIDEYTSFYLKEGKYSFDLCNAEDISITLTIDRSNVSRLLNQMFNDFELIKVKGRPTIFLSKNILQNVYRYTNIPQVIDSRENLQELFESNTTNKAINIRTELNLVGNDPEGTLYTIVNRILPGILFVQDYSVNIVLDGVKGSGREEFCKELFEYSKKSKRFSKQSVIHYSSYASIDENYEKAANQINVNSTGMIIVQTRDKIDRSKIRAYIEIVTNNYQNNHVDYPVIVYIINNSNDKDLDYFKNMTSYYARFPSLHERTPKEIIEIVLRTFQEQADHFGVRIKVTNDTIVTLANTDFPNGVVQMISEVKALVSRVLYLNRQVNSKIIYASRDLIVGDLYMNVREDSYYIEQVNQLVYQVLSEVIDFFPNVESEAVQMISAVHQGKRIFLDVPKRTILQHTRNSFLYTTSEAMLALSPETKRLSLLLGHVFSRYAGLKNDYALMNKIYGMLLAMIGNQFEVDYSNENFETKENTQSRNLSNSIIEVVESKYELQLRTFYKAYIRNFIYYALTLTVSNKISILVISNQLQVADNYAKHINIFLGTRICHSMHYDVDLLESYPEKFTNQLSEAICRTNRGKGVLIVSDRKLPDREVVKLVSNTTIPIVTLYRTNLYLLEETAKYLDVPSINITVLLYNSIRNKKSIKEFQSKNSLTNKQNRMNSNLLVADVSHTFEHVNPLSSNEASYSIIEDITKQLDIELTNGLIIEFLFHMNAMFERYAQKNQVRCQGSEIFIQHHRMSFNIVKKAIHSQKELLGYLFDDCEIIVLTELIENYL